MRIGNVKIFFSRPFFWGYNHVPNKYVKCVDKDGVKVTIVGGVYKVIYIGWLEIRIFNKLFAKSKYEKEFKNEQR